MCNKAVNTSPSAIPFVPQCYQPQELIDEIVIICPLLTWRCFWSKNQKRESQKICDEVFSKDSFIIKYYPDKCKTQKYVIELWCLP